MSVTYQSKFHGASIISDDGRRFTISNLSYLGGGREGEVFKLDNFLAAKIYSDNPISPNLRDKLVTLCAQRDEFHELVIGPSQMIRLEGQSMSDAAGFIMKYLPEAKPLDCMRWKPSLSIEEEYVFDQMVSNFIYDISDALESIHANRVFVCDLKPQNILISDLRPYLVDFDSCSVPNYPGETFTIQYLDPRIRDRVPDAVGPNEEFSALTDWWALAVVAFELFIGVLPWAGIHPQYRKDPQVFRSYNYSAVILDPAVRTPIGMRPPEWLESKPKIKNYFKKIFSPDPASRFPLVEVLDAYFPRETHKYQAQSAVNLMDRLVRDDSQRKFFNKLILDLTERAREKTIGRQQARLRLLDMMYTS